MEAGSAWLQHPAFSVRLDLSGELRIVEWVNRLTGATLQGSGSELTCWLDAAQHRIDLPGWRQTASSAASLPPDDDAGYRERFYDPFCDDSSWGVMGNAVGYTTLIPSLFSPQHETDPRANRYQWVRSHFILPESADGQPVWVTLGGYSLGDFDFMRIFLNGIPLGERHASGLFREPGVFSIHPDSDAYRGLRFGQDNVIAVQLKDYFTRPPELEARDSFRAFTMHTCVWNVFFEQYITVGAPLQQERFQVCSYDVLGSGQQAGFAVRLQSAAGVFATLRYSWSADAPVLVRRATLDNGSSIELPLLDIDLSEFQTDSAGPDSGGVGFPAYAQEQFFVSSTHPASLNQCDKGRFRVRHFQGTTLAKAQPVELPEVVRGVSAPGDCRRVFRDYVEGQARRQQRDHHRAYHLFWPMNDDETFYKYENRELSRLDACARLQEEGIIHFDTFCLGYFQIDAGGDFLHFDAQRWPNGPDEFWQRLQRSGMKLGLGLAGTSPTCWSLGNNPVLADSLNTVYGAGGFCMVAPGYRTMVTSGMRDYRRQLGMDFFVIDQTFHRCHNPHHGHRIGNYSITASFDACIALFQMLDREHPDLFIQLYWGFSSPWWLQWADTLFEAKGLWMEARNPTEQPTLYFRDSVTLGLDRAHEFAAEIPRSGKDSLGIWLTKNLWNSNIGPERWADGLVMDLCRGSLLAQLWGHPDMLSDDEWRDAARLIGLMQTNPQCFSHPRLVLGNPWTDTLYGYGCSDGDRAFIALNNCSWTEQIAEVELNERWGLPDAGPWKLYRWWPAPSQLTNSPGEPRFTSGVRYPLRPFDIVLLEVVRPDAQASCTAAIPSLPLPLPASEPAQAIPLQVQQLNVEPDAAFHQEYHALVQADGDYDLAPDTPLTPAMRPIAQLDATLPLMAQSGTLAIIVRMFCGPYAARLGIDASNLLSASALLDGDTLHISPVAGRGEEVSWQVYHAHLPPASVPRSLSVTITSAVDPACVRFQFDGVLIPGMVKTERVPFQEGPEA